MIKIPYYSMFIFRFGVLLLILLNPLQGFPWHSIVLDKQTREPIENAVIVRSWDREIAGPAGTVTSFLGMKETLTDEHGKFMIFGKLYFPGIPLLTCVVENKPIVYRPGYKFLILDEKKSVIELEKIPTFINLRKDEVKKARGNYEVDFYETKILRDIISREEEFIESPRNPLKVVHYPVQPEKPAEIVLVPSSEGGLGLALVIPHKGAERNYKGAERKSSVAYKNDEIDFNIRILADQSLAATVRSGAASFLGNSKDPRAVPSLINALNDEDTGVRREAVMALGEMKDSRAVPFLINALRDKDKGIRFEAAKALGKFNDPRAIGAVEPLIQDLGSKDENIQSSATYALVQIGKPAVEPLIKALKNSDKTIRREAALALGGIGDTKGVDPLIELLNANEHGVSWAAALALGNFNDPKAAKALVNALRFKNGYLRSRLSEPLLRMGPLAVDYLIIALNDKDAEVRGQAAMILGYIKDLRSVEPLMNALNDENSEVRKNAAIALGFLKDPKSIKSLISAWNDEDSEVRVEASKALIKIGTSAIQPLLSALNNKNSYFRWRAAWCLGVIKDPAAVEALLDRLNDKVSEVKWMAIDALGEIGIKEVAEKLSNMCNDEDAGIREKVKSSLMKITGENICKM
jgi:HEAT repeat protein